MKKLYIYLFIILLSLNYSCKKYLDVIPDNLATIESAFSNRTSAEKYLFTCYGYMPEHGNPRQSSFLISDEIWTFTPQVPAFYFNQLFEDLALNRQNMVNPTLDFWNGLRGGKPLFRGIRDCNIFLENIDRVSGLQEVEKQRWISEVKFLKAYYHFYLLKMYGPIPLIRENLAVDADQQALKVKREPIDICVNYIVELLDEATQGLPLVITSESSELGRITQNICLTVKAHVLVMAASPLFNGNSEFANFKDQDDQPFFNPIFDQNKWKIAADACLTAITSCQASGLKLYTYVPVVNTFNLAPETIVQMSIRNSVAQKWNSEVIWGNTNSLATEIQSNSQASIDPTRLSNMGVRLAMAPTLRMAELFYSNNGVPIEEDLFWNNTGGGFAARYNVQTARESDRFNLQPGYQTAALHFQREDRFYADLGFDGGIWYGQGKYDDKDPWLIKAKFNQYAGKRSDISYSATGYFLKKVVHFQNIIEAGDNGPYTVVPYPWPVYRLADLYLLYAEALNESAGPSVEVFKYLDLIRERAGLEPVVESWLNYSRFSNKPETKDGLRDIIQQERLIELAFEGKRFWDLLRWKKARNIFNQPIKGWDIEQDLTANYYRVRTLFNRKFTTRDYLWPISENNLNINNMLVQNPGW